MLSCHDSRAAPQIAQTASPVCGTRNFSSVRLYSAPQVHCTIVTIPMICASDHGISSPGNFRCSLASWPSLCCRQSSRWTEGSPVRVILRPRGASELGLLFPKQQTWGDCSGMSVRCQKRKSWIFILRDSADSPASHSDFTLTATSIPASSSGSPQ